MCSPGQASSPAAAASPNMAGAKAPLVIQNVALSPPQLKCVMHPCKPLPEDLAALLSGERVITAFGIWSPAQHPLTVLHAMSGDAGPDIRLLPAADDPGAQEAFNQWHQADAATGRCTVIRFPTRDLELVLVPVLTKTGPAGTPGPCYWGYTVTANLLPLMASTIHAAKLIAVLDIDETLLMAHTVDSLQTRLARIKAEREAKAAELAAAEAAAEGDKVQQLQLTIRALKSEQVLLRKDYEMLSSFRQDPACRVVCDGHAFEPSWECTTLSSGVAVTRPVVRLELGGRPVWFTRVLPESRSTSLLIRPRPGWEVLRSYLSGQEAAKANKSNKPRWEVYLCTTAEREYAWEAWRLLDPQGSLFPLDQLAWRMLCVAHPQKKDLLNVLRKREADAAAARGLSPQCASDPQLVSDKVRASRPPRGVPAPLCVVVDDRLDVWEEDSRKAVLRVMPFHPHKEAAALDLGAARCPAASHQQATDSEGELGRVAATLRELRGTTYLTLDKDVREEVSRLTTQGCSDGLQDTAASITSQLLLPLPPVPRLLADSAHRPPAALGSTEQDDRASDLRLLAHDGSMGQAPSAAAAPPAAAPAAAAAAAAAGGGGGPRDPRKRRLEAAAEGATEAAAAAAAAAAEGANGTPAVAAAGAEPAAAAAAAAAAGPAPKRRRKEKPCLFEGVDLASIVSAVTHTTQQQQEDQQQGQQQQPQQQGQGQQPRPQHSHPQQQQQQQVEQEEPEDDLLLPLVESSDDEGPAQWDVAAAQGQGAGSSAGPEQQQQPPPPQQQQQQPVAPLGGYQAAANQRPNWQQQQQQGPGPGPLAPPGPGSTDRGWSPGLMPEPFGGVPEQQQLLEEHQQLLQEHQQLLQQQQQQQQLLQQQQQQQQLFQQQQQELLQQAKGLPQWMQDILQAQQQAQQQMMQRCQQQMQQKMQEVQQEAQHWLQEWQQLRQENLQLEQQQQQQQQQGGGGYGGQPQGPLGMAAGQMGQVQQAQPGGMLAPDHMVQQGMQQQQHFELQQGGVAGNTPAQQQQEQQGEGMAYCQAQQGGQVQGTTQKLPRSVRRRQRAVDHRMKLQQQQQQQQQQQEVDEGEDDLLLPLVESSDDEGPAQWDVAAAQGQGAGSSAGPAQQQQQQQHGEGPTPDQQAEQRRQRNHINNLRRAERRQRAEERRQLEQQQQQQQQLFPQQQPAYHQQQQQQQQYPVGVPYPGFSGVACVQPPPPQLLQPAGFAPAGMQGPTQFVPLMQPHHLQQQQLLPHQQHQQQHGLGPAWQQQQQLGQGQVGYQPPPIPQGNAQWQHGAQQGAGQQQHQQQQGRARRNRPTKQQRQQQRQQQQQQYGMQQQWQ